MNPRIQKTVTAFLLSVLSISLCFAFFAMDFLGKPELSLERFLYEERTISDEILIVGIDDATIGDLEEGGLGSIKTWTRSYYADVIQKASESGASGILLDILLTESSSGVSALDLYKLASKEPTYQEFGQQLSTYLETPHPNDVELAHALEQTKNVFFISLLTGEPFLQEGLLNYEEMLPLAGFLEGLVTPVFVNNGLTSESQSDASVNSMPVVARSNEEVLEGAGLQLIRAHLGLKDLGSWDPTSSVYELANFEIPIQNGKMLIHYAGGPGSFDTVSFLDVYRGKVDPSIFEGKMVLIGVTSAVFQDQFFTPIDSNQRMNGIEIHANAIQTILDEAFLTYQSHVDFAMTFGLILLFSALIFMHAPILWSGVLLAVELAMFPFYAQWRFEHGVIVNLIWPVLGLVATYLMILVYRNFTEFAEKRKLKDAFGRYVSPELVEQIGEHPEMLKLGGERRSITALFLDIENFTNLSESLSPQETVKVINMYFDALSKVIMSQGGTVDKYEGDAIMALFGAPVPMEAHAVKGCETALLIREKMSELNASSGYKLNIRIGLSSGEAIVGNMGSENRFDYTAMGDTVNTASRLEGANKFYSTRILVSEGTFQMAKDKIFMRRVDTVCLKGKDNALNVYEVLGPIEGASEEGKTLVQTWETALTAYQKGEWDLAEKGMKEVMAKMPEDGPSKTLLGRIAMMRMTPRQNWDGVWRFEVK